MGQFYKLTDWVGKFMDKFEESLALDPSKVLNTDAWKAHVDRLKRILGEELFSQFEKWMKKMGKSWGDLTEWMHENEDALAAVVDKYKKRLDDLAQLTVYTFHKMIAEGRGWLETLRAMQDPLRSLIGQYEQLGLTIPKVLVPMKKLLDLMELKPRIFENLDAAVGILESLGNAAYMNQEIFNTLAKSVTNFARAFLGVTGSLREFMSVAGQLKSWQKQVLTPLVAQFVGMAAIFGLRVPGWMKEFVTTQLGVNWKEFRDTAKEQANMARASLDKLKDLNKKNLQLVNRATKRNDLIRDTNRGIGDVVDAVRELGRTAGTKVTKAQTGFGPEWVRGPRSFYIEPGAEELVNIIPKGRTGATGGQQPIVVNTNIKPVVVPGPNGSWLIKFLQEAADNERLTFNPKSIRSQ